MKNKLFALSLTLILICSLLFTSCGVAVAPSPRTEDQRETEESTYQEESETRAEERKTVDDTDTAELLREAPLVEDALNYQVNAIPQPGTEGEGFEDFVCSVRIPEIISEKPGAKSLNQTIYNKYIALYNTLKGGELVGWFYRVDYHFQVYEDLIAIYLENSDAPQNAGILTGYEVYYYDWVKDTPVSAEEYIFRTTGLSPQELLSKIKSTAAYKEYYKEYNDYEEVFPKLYDFMTDGKKSTAFLTDYGYLEWTGLEVDLFS